MLGEDPADGGRRWKAQLGIVLQSGAGDSQLTCRELLQAQASYYPDPRDPDEVLALVGLTEKAKSRGRSLSGGQRRRLDVALGIVGRPDPALPRRADDRLRPRGAPAVLVADPLAARARHHDAAHHPLPGRGRGAGRPGRASSPAAGWSRSPSPSARAAGSPHPPSSAGPRTASGAPRRPPRRRRSCASWPPGSPARSRTWPSPGPTLEDVYLRDDRGARMTATTSRARRRPAVPGVGLPHPRRRSSSRSSSGSASRWSSP